MAEFSQLVTAKRKLPRVTLDERASATVLAFCKDEDMGLSEALSFIVNDWATLKLAALRACAPERTHCQEAVKEL